MTPPVLARWCANEDVVTLADMPNADVPPAKDSAPPLPLAVLPSKVQLEMLMTAAALVVARTKTAPPVPKPAAALYPAGSAAVAENVPNSVGSVVPATELFANVDPLNDTEW